MIRKLLVLFGTVLLLISTYLIYQFTVLDKQLQNISEQNAQTANQLWQKLDAAKLSQQQTTSEEYQKLEVMVNAGNTVAQMQTQATGNQDTAFQESISQQIDLWVDAGDNPHLSNVWYPGDTTMTWSFSPVQLFTGAKRNVQWILKNDMYVLAWVEAEYDAETNRFSDPVMHYSQYGDTNGRQLHGDSVEAWY